MEHVIELYAAQGFRRFLLATGLPRRADRALRRRARAGRRGWRCTAWTPGLDTPTGGRIKRLEGLLAGEPTFCVTYADGLADIDLARLLAFHEAHGALATITVVRPELQFGVAELDGGEAACSASARSPAPSTGSTAASSACAPPRFGYLPQDSVLEREPLRRLAADGQLRAYRHEGFWECMDTYKDAVALNDLWASGAAPWRAAGPRLGSRAERRPTARAESHPMIVLGIDPGLANAGYGVVARRGRRMAALDGGVIDTPAGAALESRLASVHGRVLELIDEHRPAAMALEQLYFGQNVQTAFAVGHARGVTMLAAGERGGAVLLLHPPAREVLGLRQRPRGQGPGRADGADAAVAARAAHPRPRLRRARGGALPPERRAARGCGGGGGGRGGTAGRGSRA